MRAIPVVILLTLALLSTLACSGGSSADEHVEAMATEHAGDEPVASPAAEPEAAGPVEEMEVTYATIGGEPVTGFLARPEGVEAAPAVLVIHEWWGLNDNIRAMARRLAGEGYTALAVDLYGGEAAASPEAARELMQGTLARQPELEENLRQAYRYLEDEQGAPAVGTIGWCFGGGWSLRAALLLPQEIDATVIYYGRLETDPEVLRPLTMPILGIFGSEDQGIPVETVKEFEAALAATGKDARIHIYEGANHAFANPSGTRYKADAAEDAWAKTLAFFKEHLQGG